MDLFKFFKVKPIEELNDDDDNLKLDQKNTIQFDENNDENCTKNDIKTHKKALKMNENNKKSNKINDKSDIKKHYIGHRKRLKEKILNVKNLESMADYELLESLLMYAIPRNDVKPISKNLLNKFKTLRNIFYAPLDQINLVEGIGENTSCFFKILNEIFCRFHKIEIQEDILLNSPDKVAIYCQGRMGFLKHEQFRVLFLNKKNRLIKDIIIQNGTIDRANIFPRELVLQALQLGAGGMILVHNHPSGDPSPSTADINITHEIKKAANLMNILIYDHLIVSKNSYYSMKNHRIF